MVIPISFMDQIIDYKHKLKLDPIPLVTRIKAPISSQESLPPVILPSTALYDEVSLSSKTIGILTHHPL